MIRHMDYRSKLKAWKKRREKIASQLNRGVPAAVIAVEAGISRQRVYQLARGSSK